ncbi:VOC family protein [Dyadobacter sp. CY345]|uniref:VOC family protein n=1 Tax=Dyadobacter sp. CY345 TaxID=2909335 RepID=UPI001F24BD9E|nr:VOC family protein [Dyadobacter sp. CY345]MCF2447228.1 VOC family protein [Dyadobacter sp. CY345]
MFRDTKAFSGFSVDNIEKAKQFYGETLQLEVTHDEEMNILQLHINGGNDIIVYEKPNHTPATFTILNFPVPNVQQAVEKLKKAGVQFESYDMPNMKTDEDDIFRGGGPLIAWFTDPAGNILSVLETE